MCCLLQWWGFSRAQPYFDLIPIVLKVFPDIYRAVLAHLHIIVGWTTGLTGGTLWTLLLFLMFYAWFRTYLFLWQTWVDRGVKFQTMLECTTFCTFVIMNPLLGWKVNRQKIMECCRRTQVQEPPSQCVFSEVLPFGRLSGGNCRVNPRLRFTAGSISGTELSPYLCDEKVKAWTSTHDRLSLCVCQVCVRVHGMHVCGWRGWRIAEFSWVESQFLGT